MPELEIHYDTNNGDWAALYRDGNLDTVGEASGVEAQALIQAGVALIHDDAFMRGGKDRADTAKNLDQVKSYREFRVRRRAEAADLRAKAAMLLEG